MSSRLLQVGPLLPMKSRQIIPLLFLVVGAIGIAAVLMSPSTFWARQVDQGFPAAAGPPAALPAPALHLAEVRLAHARRAPAPDGSVSSAEVDDSGAARGGPGEPPQVATLAELQEFREYVAGTLSDIRTQEAAGQFRSLEERAAKLDETMSTLEDWLELTPHQSDRMRTVLLSRIDRETEYLRLWEKAADQEILDELRVSDREALREELSGFLTAHQLHTYMSKQGSIGK